MVIFFNFGIESSPYKIEFAYKPEPPTKINILVFSNSLFIIFIASLSYSPTGK